MRWFAIISVFLFSVPVFAQQKMQNSLARQKNKEVMQAQILQLKSGALLVRLATRQNTIDALKKRGFIAKANETEKKQKAYNKTIVSAFRARFTFCPVYFFYSQYSDSIKSKKLGSVVFLNDSLQPDTSIHLKSSAFLIAEFSYVQQDTTRYKVNRSEAEQNAGIPSTVAAGANLGLKALIILSDQFVQLKNPFPYFTKISGFPPVYKKKPRLIVKQMNRKLLEYHKTASRN